MEYNPKFFDPKDLADAKDIILGHHSIDLEFRWQRETEFTVKDIAQYLSRNSHAVIMDFGCGIGRLSKALIDKYSCKVFGVDLSQEMLDLSVNYVASENFAPTLRANLEKLPEQVDMIVAAWVLQHCPDLEKEILFFKKSLRPGGIVYLIDQFQRVIPIVREAPDKPQWLSDHQSVHYALSTQFLPIETRPLPPESTSQELRNTSAIRIYRFESISEGNCEKIFDNVIKNHPQPVDFVVAHGLGEELLRQSQLQKGSRFMELGRQVFGHGQWPLYGDPLPQTGRPRWHGEGGQGKTLLYYCEGGLGDSIAALKFIKPLSKIFSDVIVAIEPSLFSIVYNMEGVTETIPKNVVQGRSFDCWLPSYSAPLALGYEYGDFPQEAYLAAKSDSVEKFKEIIGMSENLKVGIRWRGNHHTPFATPRGTLPRDFPPEKLFALADIPGTQFFSLQNDSDESMIPQNSEIVKLGGYLKTWDDTLGAIANLDLVISSCTSLPHAAGAMGKEVWLLLPAFAYYLWSPPGKGTPWYPHHRLFRQNKPEREVFVMQRGSVAVPDWDNVFTKVAQALGNHVSSQG